MTEARFQSFLDAWERRDVEAVLHFLDAHCVHEPAASVLPGYTAVGHTIVRESLAHQFAADSSERLVSSSSLCGTRAMLEWTAFQRQADGRPELWRGCDWFEFTGDYVRRISGFRKVGHPAEQPLTRVALLAHIRASYARFQARLAPLSDAQLTSPGAVGTWSIKDVLAHLTAWH